MRKIGRQMLAAVRERRDMRQSNTTVAQRNGRMEVRLHGHLIGFVSPTHLTISNCGWATNTTKSRLNALLELVPGHHGIHQANFEWFLDGQPWNGTPVALEVA